MRPGLDEPARLPVDADVAGVGDACGDSAADGGRQLAESELIGLRPLAALLDVADHIGAPPAPTTRTAARGAADGVGSATSNRDGARAAARGGARGRAADAGHVEPAPE